MGAIAEAVKRTKVYYCLDCGKCTSTCPISRLNGDYSPRRMVSMALLDPAQDLMGWELLWSCLTCKLCSERCPSDVDYAKFVQLIRREAHKAGEDGICTHGGAFQSLMRIMTAPDLRQNRLGWVPKDLKISNEGEILYFVGCLPYFDIFFEELGVKTLGSAKGAIRILNELGISPVLLRNERCCGHDLLWSGDFENFRMLGEHNLGEIRKSGAKRVVFSCPEGYRTFKVDYALHFGALPFEVQHISQLLSENLSSNGFQLKKLNKKVTYQDPCRLGRHLSIYEEPRQAIGAVPGVELVEMNKHKKNSICCGTSSWMNCTTYSKQIQVNRLKEAKSTGADLLITACPKCEIHFRCTMNDEKAGEEVKMEIKDVVSLVADQLPKKQGKRRST